MFAMIGDKDDAGDGEGAGIVVAAAKEGEGARIVDAGAGVERGRAEGAAGAPCGALPSLGLASR